MIYLEKDPTLQTLALQEALKARNLYDGPLDNWEGKLTRDGMAAFRKLFEPDAPQATGRQVIAEGVELIRSFESCLKKTSDGRFTSYPDPGWGWKFPTIGWGTIQYPNGDQVAKGDIITQARADELLAWEVGEKAAQVERLLKVPVTNDQFAALVSFSYNAGAGDAGLGGSTLLRCVNNGDNAGAAAQFAKWKYSNGKVYSGLIRRRASERNLFLGKRPFIVQS